MMILIVGSPIFWLPKKMSDLLQNRSKEDASEKNAEEADSQSSSDKEAYLENEINKIKEKDFKQTNTAGDEAEYSKVLVANFKHWSNQLVSLIDKINLETYFAHGKRGEYVNLSHSIDSTIKLSAFVFDTLGLLAAQFNDSRFIARKSNRVRLATTKHLVYDLKNDSNLQSSLLSEFRITSQTRSLSVRCEPGKLFAFLLPANVNLDVKNNETQDRQKLAIVLDSTHGGDNWSVNGLPVANDEIVYLCKALLRDLVILSCLDNLAYESGQKFEHADNIHRVGIARGFKDNLTLESELSQDLVKDLVLAQQNTVQKLLRQQEEIQADIARDLHDTVLADIMMLVRRASSEDKMSNETLVDTLEDISSTIREICQGLVPRDLKDWGLVTVLEDLVDKTAERIEADCLFEVGGDIPDLPSAVQLHIFRIVQEGLNNIEKYAEALNVKVSLSQIDDVISVKVEDDGRGFDLENSRDSSSKGGFGLPSINERLEIIRAYYPAKLKFDSKVGLGTTIQIDITVESFD